MTTMTKELIEQKKQLLMQLTAETEQLKNELVEAGAWPLDDEDLEKAAGGVQAGSILKGGSGEFRDKRKEEPVKQPVRTYL